MFTLIQISIIVNKIAKEIIRVFPVFIIYTNIKKTKSLHSYYTIIKILSREKIQYTLNIKQYCTYLTKKVKRLYYILY